MYSVDGMDICKLFCGFSTKRMAIGLKWKVAKMPDSEKENDDKPGILDRSQSHWGDSIQRRWMFAVKI